jgi:hypothetical protein
MSNETQNPTYKCPVCNSDVNKPREYIYSPEQPMISYSCPRCSDFDLPYHFNVTYLLNNDNRKIAALSHWIRIKYESIKKDKTKAPPIILNEQLVNSIIKNPPPKPAEQADSFVLWLGSKAPGENIEFQLKDQLSLIGSATSEELSIAIDYLIRAGLVQGKIMRTGGGLMGVDIALSFEGWQYYEELKRGATESHKAFMAMDYSNKTLEKIVNDFFRDAVKSTGFVLYRLDDVSKAGPIDDRLRVEIQTSRFLIADLSHNNSGSYWEAGYAEGLGKPVIYTCDKKIFDNPKTKPHFDTNHHLTIKWDKTNPEEAAKKLKATIRATLPEAAKLTDD